MGSGYAYTASYALNTAEGTTPEIDYSGVESAMIFIPAGSSITSIAFYAAPKIGGTYLPVYQFDYLLATGTGTYTEGAVTIGGTVTAGRAYPVPACLRGAGAIKAVVNAAGSVNISFAHM